MAAKEVKAAVAVTAEVISAVVGSVGVLIECVVVMGEQVVTEAMEATEAQVSDIDGMEITPLQSTSVLRIEREVEALEVQMEIVLEVEKAATVAVAAQVEILLQRGLMAQMGKMVIMVAEILLAVEDSQAVKTENLVQTKALVVTENLTLQ